MGTTANWESVEIANGSQASGAIQGGYYTKTDEFRNNPQGVYIVDFPDTIDGTDLHVQYKRQDGTWADLKATPDATKVTFTIADIEGSPLQFAGGIFGVLDEFRFWADTSQSGIRTFYYKVRR